MVNRRAAVIAAALAAVLVTREDRPTEPEVASPVNLVLPALEVTSTSTEIILTGAGDIDSCSTANDDATATLLDGIGGEVFTLGDNAYTSGTATQYVDCYGRRGGATRHAHTWLPGTRTTPHPARQAISATSAPRPATTKGYYSYDIGDWHVVVLNSKVTMSASSAQIAWLKGDLAASTKECTLAYWHKPRYYSSGTSRTPKPPGTSCTSMAVDVNPNWS